MCTTEEKQKLYIKFHYEVPSELFGGFSTHIVYDSLRPLLVVDKYVQVRAAYIADRANLTTRTVSKALNNLKECGFLDYYSVTYRDNTGYHAKLYIKAFKLYFNGAELSTENNGGKLYTRTRYMQVHTHNPIGIYAETIRALINNQKRELTVKDICAMLGFKKSVVYKWLKVLKESYEFVDNYMVSKHCDTNKRGHIISEADYVASKEQKATERFFRRAKEFFDPVNYTPLIKKRRFYKFLDDNKEVLDNLFNRTVKQLI